VVIAPDKFAGTLTARQAAQAIADGWARRRPKAELRQLPMSDGGPGFCDVLATALPRSRRLLVEAADPLGRPVRATLLQDGDTVYVESAQAIGLDLLAESERDPERTSSAGLAPLLAAAVAGDAARIVVGLGGSATVDGGRGLLDAAERTAPGLLARLRDRTLVIASDVTNPLLGPAGASAVFGPQKGASREAVARLEGRMQRWVAELPGLAEVAEQPGAGAAGGLGALLLWLGGRCEAGAELVARAVGLGSAIAQAELVVTGEGTYDSTSLRGKVIGAVASAASDAALPCLVLAGQAVVGRREAAAHGVDDVLTSAEVAGSVKAALAAPEQWLSAAASQLAATWSPA
jgi:glycerate kinase